MKKNEPRYGLTPCTWVRLRVNHPRRAQYRRTREKQFPINIESRLTGIQARG